MSFVTQIGILFLLPTLLFKTLNGWKMKETFDFFSYKKTSWKVILLAIGLGAVVFFLNVYVSTFFNSIIQFLGYKPASSAGGGLPATPWALILDLIATAVLPAICEETLHRGMLLKGNSSYGMRNSILISGVLFGLLHLNVEQFFYATLIGWFLGYLCWGSNSIYPCMIVHFMNNGLSVLLSFAKQKGWAIGNLFTNIVVFMTQNQFWGILLFVLVLVLLVLLAYEGTKLIFKCSFDYHFGNRQRQLANMAIRESFFKQVEGVRNNTESQENLFKTGDKVVYVDLKEFVNYIEKSIGDSLKKNEKSGENPEKMQKNAKKIENIELKTKILVFGSIFLGAIVTAMTYLWGVLR